MSLVFKRITNLLSLDPGLTTGWCFIDWGDGHELFRTGNILHGALASELRNLRSRLEPQLVVIEGLPDRLDNDMRHVQETCHLIFPKFDEIRPGQWKPRTGTQPVPARNTPPYTYSPHERDAYRMAKFWLLRHPEIYANDSA